MGTEGFFHYHPERIAWIGVLILFTGGALSVPHLWTMGGGHSLFEKVPLEKMQTSPSYSFSLGLRDSFDFATPHLQEEIEFSFDPPRPQTSVDEKRLLVRLKQSGAVQRVLLPCRLDLEFQGDQLVFAKEKSPFWMELSMASGGQIEVRGWVETLEGSRIDAGSFVEPGQEVPIQGASEFPERPWFRSLAEARWWGHDILGGAPGERLEIKAAAFLELQKGDWVCWKEGEWQRSSLEKEGPIARIQSVSSKELILEGWDSEGYTRIALNLSAGFPFKVKGEELFSSIRVRSEKQISCMVEKQCMILKTGDWVLKTGGRWKILRKKEEQGAFLNGKQFGELFILDRILQKQGQKMIQGRLFNPGRTEAISIEIAAQASRKTKSR